MREILDNCRVFKKCDFFGWGEATSGIMNMIGSIITAQKNYQSQVETNLSNLQINRETNQANKDLSELAYRQNIEQWQRENAYNTPSATMQRFKDAGLNPNLAYSQKNDAASSPTMSYIPQKAAHLDAPKLDLSAVMAAISQIGSSIDSIMESQSKSELIKNNIDMQKELLSQLREKGQILNMTKQDIIDSTHYKGMTTKELYEKLKHENGLFDKHDELLDLNLLQKRKAVQDFLNSYTPTYDEQRRLFQSRLDKNPIQRLLHGVYNTIQSRFPMLPQNEISDSIIDIIYNAIFSY